MSNYMTLEKGSVGGRLVTRNTDGTRTHAYVLYCISQPEGKRKVYLSLIQLFSTGVSHSVTPPGFSLGNLSEVFWL